MDKKPILCVDFDGCIHGYQSGWKGAAVIPDPPVPGALRWLLDASRLFTIAVYSSRSKEPAAIDAMRRWLHDHAYRELSAKDAFELLNIVTFAREKPPAFLTIDDRCVVFEGDWSKLDPETLLRFKPWNQKPISVTR